MTIELTDAQQRKIDSYLKRIDNACRGQLKTQNLVRMIHVELGKSQRRAKRSANNTVKTESITTKIAQNEN